MEGIADRPRFLGLSPRHTWSVRSVRSVTPTIASVPSCGNVRDTQRSTEGIGGAVSAGVTGENSPHYTNQLTKMKTDRVLVKYFYT
jgi:hypothetical protein